MATQSANNELISAIHNILDQLSNEDIHALQGFGIQQAGRNGLGRDGRVYLLLGLIALGFGLFSPVYLFLKIIQVSIAILLIVGAVKVYFRPTIRDMFWIVVLLGASAIANGMVGLISFIPFNQPVFAVILGVIASIEGRWGYTLWHAYQTANKSGAEFSDEKATMATLYHQLSSVLGATPPTPNNPIVHIDSNNPLRLFLSQHLGVVLYRNGLLQVINSHDIAIQPTDNQFQQALTFPVAVQINQRKVNGTMSQISFQTFKAWQDR